MLIYLDRVGKFGRLAPTNDIGRNFKKMEKKIKRQIVLQQKQKQGIEEAKDNQVINQEGGIEIEEAQNKEAPIDIDVEAKRKLEELNYYNLDDPFIDDADDKVIILFLIYLV